MIEAYIEDAIVAASRARVDTLYKAIQCLWIIRFYQYKKENGLWVYQDAVDASIDEKVCNRSRRDNSIVFKSLFCSDFLQHPAHDVFKADCKRIETDAMRRMEARGQDPCGVTTLINHSQEKIKKLWV